jgi:hypothetical protein
MKFSALIGFLFIAGFFVMIGLFSVDSSPIKRHRKTSGVNASLNYKGQFRKAHYRPAVSAHQQAIRNRARSRYYYYQSKGKYRRKHK